tara:strand:+ start:2171 stop:3043 length:873 start_codon:yes stop_codon:yes gene_type:complete
MKKKKTYLVTGGAGFVGTNLIKRLLVDNHNVICFDNYSTGSKENEQNGCQYFDIDLAKEKEYDFLKDQPDVIFHLAALARIEPSFEFPIKTFEDNVNSTLNILDYARKNNIKVVYAGSSSYHGGVYANPYTYTKWQGEELCKMFSKIYDLSTIICRFYNVYGPYQITDGPYSAIVGIFQRQFLDKVPLTITGDGEQRRDFTHVYDIVDGLIQSSKHSFSGSIFELGTGVNYSINELARMFGEKYPIEYIPKRDGEMLTTLCNISEAKEKINYNPTQDLESYVNKWIQENL